MKKVLALILALVLVLSLVACGGGSGDGSSDASNKTSLDASNAIAETPKHIYKDVMENQARAKQNTYKMNCTVYSITDSYFEGDYELQICLPSDTLANLNKGEKVAIIGKITEIKQDEFGNITAIIFGEAELYNGTVPEVAPREDEIFTGIIKGKNNSYKGAWDIEYRGSNFLKLIYFADGEDTSSLKNGDKITFTADTYGGTDNPERFLDAKILKIE